MDFINFKILDAVDILLVAIIIYQIYRLIRGTSAFSIFVGVFIVYVIWIVVKALGMELLSLMLGQVIGVGVIAMIIVFQPEIRRFLLILGSKYSSTRGSIFKRLLSDQTIEADNAIFKEIVDACVSMGSQKIGALIVIQHKTDLGQIVSTGDRIDAIVSKRLIEGIFFKNSPQHDGAMVIARGRISAARCILPTSDNPDIPACFGLRHRAAMGISELTDAVVIVVSEETGNITLVENGNMIRELNSTQLQEKLSQTVTD